MKNNHYNKAKRRGRRREESSYMSRSTSPISKWFY
jgi:hypothetical protein